MDEREVKLSAGEPFQLPDLNGVWDGVTATPREDERLSTVYFDSEDLRLARWGLSFRFRAGEGWTVKLPTDGSGPLLIRDELVFQGSPTVPPADAVDVVKGYLRGAELRPRARLRTWRRGVLLHDPQGRLLADVVDDAVSVVHGRRTVGRFRELEVETRPDTPSELLQAVIDRLREAGAGAPDPTPKYLRAIGGSQTAPAEIVPPTLSRAASLGEVVTHAIGDGVIRLIRHDAIVRLDTDPEGVHQARVATRRLRSDLRTFRAVLDPQWTKALRAELGWLGHELGAARDADVLLARLTARARALPEISADGASEVIAALEQRRARAHAGMLEQLRGDRYLALLDKLVDAAQAPALLERKAARRAAKALRPLVRKDWRALEKKVGSLTDEPADEDLHMIRILAKRCRYAAEASTPILGKRIRRLARATRDLQDTLGELNDAVVAEHWLRDWAEHAPSTRGAFAAGELAELERTASRQARTVWPQAWRRVEAVAPP